MDKFVLKCSKVIVKFGDKNLRIIYYDEDTNIKTHSKNILYTDITNIEECLETFSKVYWCTIVKFTITVKESEHIDISGFGFEGNIIRQIHQRLTLICDPKLDFSSDEEMFPSDEKGF